jgi:hypothetical protein
MERWWKVCPPKPRAGTRTMADRICSGWYHQSYFNSEMTDKEKQQKGINKPVTMYSL